MTGNDGLPVTEEPVPAPLLAEKLHHARATLPGLEAIAGHLASPAVEA